MQRIVPGIVVLLAVAGCGRIPGAASTLDDLPALRVEQSPTPYTEVTAGPVRALIPDDWRPLLAGDHVAREGFFASPQPRKWGRMDGSVAGLSATWLDATQIGVPSDYYYLAARAPLLGGLTDSTECRARERVIVDNAPEWFSGKKASPGDFLARGGGVCDRGEVPTRWAYYIAAPGYGPVHKIGIPSSGLYVVVAVLPDSGDAPTVLRTLLEEARFGGAGLRDFIVAART